MRKTRAIRLLKEYKSLPILLVIILIAAILTGGKTLEKGNLQNLMLQVSIQGIVGFGMTYSLLCGEFDLAVGAVVKGQVAVSVNGEVVHLVVKGRGPAVFCGNPEPIGNGFHQTLALCAGCVDCDRHSAHRPLKVSPSA